MNTLVQIREKFKKAERLQQAQLLATKNGEVIPYRRSIFKKRVSQIQEDLNSKNS